MKKVFVWVALMLAFLAALSVSAAGEQTSGAYAQAADIPGIQGDRLTPEERERIFWDVMEQTLIQTPQSERKKILMVGTGSWMSTDPDRRRNANDIDATFMYVDDEGNEDLNGAVKFQQIFNANLRARAPTAEITLFVDEADEGKQDFYRGPTGNHFFYTHSQTNNPNSAFFMSLGESWLVGGKLVKEQLPVEEFWKRRGKDLPEKISDAYKFVEDNQEFLNGKLRTETDPVKRAVIIAKYVDRVEHWLKDVILKKWGKEISIEDPDLFPLVAFIDCMRDRFSILPQETLSDTLEVAASSEVKDKVRVCLGVQTDAELEQRVAELYDLTQKYFSSTRDQVERAENEIEKTREEQSLPSDKELLNCLCRCLEPPGGQFSCGYDTEDRGWSPSCSDLSNGPCICKAYGCFRGNLPTDGECYNKCYEQLRPETGPTPVEPIVTETPGRPEISPTSAPEIDGEQVPQRYIPPGNIEYLKNFLRSRGYSQTYCPKGGSPPQGSVLFWNNNAHTSVMLHDNRQIEMGHKPGGSKYVSEILPPGVKPRPNVGTYVLTEVLCPPPGSSFINERAEEMEGIDREYGNHQTQWNCHGFSANVIHESVQTYLRIRPDTDYNFDAMNLELNKGAIFGTKARMIGIPQGQVITYSQYAIEVRDDQSTVILVIEGKAEYNGEEHSLSLSSGQKAVIDPSGALPVPTTFNVNEIDKWWTLSSITGQGKEGLIFESRSKPGGSTVQIPLTLMGVKDKIGNLDITLSYNPTVLEAKEVIKGGLTATSLFENNIPSKGTIKISLADKDGFSKDGSVANIVFNVIGAEGSSSLLKILSLSANRADDMATMDIPAQDGVFTVIGVEEFNGDCNGDGRITASDALCALQMSVGKRAEDLAMDINNDKKVNSLDGRRILKMAVGSV